MQQKIDFKELLERYMTGKCTKEEEDLLVQFFEQIADGEKDSGLSADDRKRLFDAFNQSPRYTGVRATEATGKEGRLLHFFSHRFWRVAAILLLVIAAAWQIGRWQGRKGIAKTETADKRVTTPRGKSLLIMLPDSSVVHLGPASDLRYSSDYGETNRNLYLEGEAYFIVKHRRAFPFRVITGTLTTVDVGTEFNIRYRKKRPDIEITVSKGLVNVLQEEKDHPAKLATLGQLQKLQFNMVNGTYAMQVLRADETVAGWRDGILVFNKEPLSYVAAEMEQYYDVDIHFATPEIAGLMITTTLNNTSIEEALNIISLTAGVHCKKTGNTIWVR